MTRRSFPLTAIVGQEPMTLALLLNAVNPLIGGVLIRGERGTAKSTAARALAALLPPIDVVDGCPCGCDPGKPASFCPDCRARAATGHPLPSLTRPAPFVDLPVSATEDRVAGSFDLEAAMQGGVRRFQPGLLAAANRGVLYVDEVNLLDDHLVDLLLDVAATGVNIVEREGVAYQHPSRFVLVGTMNPEEGELRPQLLDRFGLCVDVTASDSVDERVAILERCLAFDRDPAALLEAWAPREAELSTRVAAACEAVDRVLFTRDDLRAIAALTGGFDLAGHRAELVLLRAACAAAALDGRSAIGDAHILRVAPFALRHRLNAEALDADSAAGVPDMTDLTVRLDVARTQADAARGEVARAVAAPPKPSEGRSDPGGDSGSMEKKTSRVTA